MEEREVVPSCSESTSILGRHHVPDFGCGHFSILLSISTCHRGAANYPGPSCIPAASPRIERMISSSSPPAGVDFHPCFKGDTICCLTLAGLKLLSHRGEKV